MLAAVMVTPSYGADETFLDGAAAFLNYKRTKKVGDTFGETMYFVGCTHGFFCGVSNEDMPEIPNGVSWEQLELIVANYVVRNPQWHHAPMEDLIYEAVKEAFPQK